MSDIAGEISNFQHERERKEEKKEEGEERN